MRRLFASYLFTSTASWTFTFLLPLIFLKVTGSPLYVTVAYAVCFLPFIVVTPFAGACSDKWNKKLILCGGELVGVLATAAIIVIGVRSDTLVPVLLLAFIAAATASTHHAAFQSIIPECVPALQVQKFNASVNGVDNVVSIFAPLAIGMLLAWIDSDLALWACVGLYAVSFGLLASMRYQPAAVRHAQSRVLPMIAAGFAYVWRQPTIRTACLLFVCVNFGIRIFFANIVYVFEVVFGLPEAALGPLFAIIGVGAIAGSVLAPQVIGRASYGAVIVWCSVAVGLASGVAMLASDPYVLAAIWGLSATFQSFIVVAFFTLRQKIVPAEILGRTVAVSRLLAYLSIPLSSVAGGALLERNHDYRLLLAISCLTILVASLACFATPLYRKRAMMPAKGMS